MAADSKHKLYFGHNLSILREHVPDGSVDLVYLDPPFNSAVNYNILSRENSGEGSAPQTTAFEDTWRWGAECWCVDRGRGDAYLYRHSSVARWL